MFRLAICDDDTLHMQNTLRCARETPEAADCDIRTFSAPGELMDAVTGGGYRPHIALLDICMPDSSGIELAQRLHEKLPRCQVIFVSSFLDYATSVYDVEHVYFILKSQMAQRLGPALRRAMDALGTVRADLLLEESRGFIRCHQSYWVNLSRVRCIRDGAFVMESGGCVPISRTYQHPAREAFFRSLVDGEK